MFSPYYARARRIQGGAADPQDHCAMNLALYGERGKRWCMTERDRHALTRERDHLGIGPSALTWLNDTLVADMHEMAVPWPVRLRGRVRVAPRALATQVHALDAHGRHLWQPLAPRAHVDVDFPDIGLRWRGQGYLDTNAGAAPLEADFVRWDWSRAALPDGRSALLYDVHRRDGSGHLLAMTHDADGTAHAVAAPRLAALPASRWGVPRNTRADDGARVLQTLEDTPFYARSLLRTQWQGTSVTAVHESLSLDRFASRWVQWMLPFRMPRRRG